MTDLEDWLVHQRSRRGVGKAKRMDPSVPAAVWHEEELLDGEVVDTMAAVVRTGGCSHDRDHGGCTMCGYASETPHRPPTVDEYLSQVRALAARRGDARWVKLYTSGSMLDPDEVPPVVLEAIVEAFDDVDMLTVESRAEHITAERVRTLGDPSRTEVAIGLESACDRVLDGSVHKGMDLAAFQRAAAEVTGEGASVRTYVLLKPPFLTEAEAIDDSIEAIEAAASAGSSVVSLNPVNVQTFTLVDRLHHMREWEPPWLWSVVEVLRRTAGSVPSTTRVISAPTAGGKVRGAHNCGRCDGDVVRAIEFHRLSNDPEELDAVPDCGCRPMWRSQLDLEGLMQGPFAPFGYRRSSVR